MNDENQCCKEPNQDGKSKEGSCCSGGSCTAESLIATVTTLDWQGILNQVKDILVDPVNCWGKIKEQQKPVKEIYLTYLVPLTIVGVVAQVIGNAVFGGTFGFIHGIAFAIVTSVLQLALLFVGGYIFSKLATYFEATVTHEDGFRLVAYSTTASLVAGLLAVFPPIGILALLFSLYSLYTLYSGVPTMTGITQKRLPYFCAAMVCYFIAGFVINLVVIAALGLKLAAV